MLRSPRDRVLPLVKAGTISLRASSVALLAQPLERLGAESAFTALELGPTQSHILSQCLEARGMFCVVLLEESQASPDDLTGRAEFSALELVINEGLELWSQGHIHYWALR